MNPKKIIISGIAAGVAIFIITFIVDTLIQLIAPYDVMALGGMRAIDDPLMMLFFAYPFVIGVTLAILYDITKTTFTGTIKSNGIKLGLMGWVVASIPSAFVVFTSMNYPLGFTLSSTIGTLLYMLGAGLVIAKLS
tara:strand:+ start:210 stop:617 length:408 start_codon:yes stop_codon:yes gene_type:complete